MKSRGTIFSLHTSDHSPSMWPDQDETLELLGGAERGDAEAANRLLDRHRDSLHRMVACRLNPRRGAARGCQRHRAGCAADGQPPPGRISEESAFRFTPGCGNWRATGWPTPTAASWPTSANVAREQAMPAGDRSSLDPVAQVRDHELTPAAMLLQEGIRRALSPGRRSAGG